MNEKDKTRSGMEWNGIVVGVERSGMNAGLNDTRASTRTRTMRRKSKEGDDEEEK